MMWKKSLHFFIIISEQTMSADEEHVMWLEGLEQRNSPHCLIQNYLQQSVAHPLQATNTVCLVTIGQKWFHK